MATHWKVYDRDGELRAAVKHAEDAAILVAALGDETTIRRNNLIVWHEGHEKQPAGESYDFVASMVHSRHEGYVVRELGWSGASRIALVCDACGAKAVAVKAEIDITTSGHTDQRCPCGGPMVLR